MSFYDSRFRLVKNENNIVVCELTISRFFKRFLIDHQGYIISDKNHVYLVTKPDDMIYLSIDFLEFSKKAILTSRINEAMTFNSFANYVYGKVQEKPRRT